MLRLGALTLVMSIAALVAPSVASANSKIVYVCDLDLCKVDIDAGTQVQLTTDGSEDRPYLSPSLSLDGTKLAFARKATADSSYPSVFLAGGDAGDATAFTDAEGDALTGNPVRINADGSRIGYLHTYPYYNGQTVFTYFSPRSVDAGGGNQQTWAASPFGYTDVAWGPDGLLSSAEGPSGRNVICLLQQPNPDSSGCERIVADDPGHDLTRPAVSPDGQLVAAEYSCVGDGCEPGTGIELFRYSDGAPVGKLTSGADREPAFSPDGNLVTFTRGADIWVSNGESEQKLIPGGSEPTWGAAPAVPGGGGGQQACTVPNVVGKKLAAAKKRIRGAHCAVGTVKRKKASKRKRGRVLRQSPHAGRHLASGGRVNLVVGRR